MFERAFSRVANPDAALGGKAAVDLYRRKLGCNLQDMKMRAGTLRDELRALERLLREIGAIGQAERRE